VRRPAAGAAVLLTALLVLASAGCAGTVAAYRESASTAVQTELGGARTAALAARSWLGGDLTSASATVIVGDADRTVGGAESDFAAADPPVGAGGLHASVTGALGDTADAVAALRVAVDLGDRAAVQTATRRVTTTADRLEALGVRLR
jgi:hypothetical protein